MEQLRAALARRPVGASGALTLTVVAAAAYVTAVAWGTSAWSYDTWAAVVVAPLLTLGILAVAKGIARRAGDPSIVSFVMFGWSVKLAGSAVRWWTAFHLYDKADAQSYHGAGRAVSDLFRQGTFDLTGAPVRGGSTKVIEVATGAVYTVTGPSSMAGCFVFAWCAFLGTILLWRAFALAVPDGDHKRYAAFLFLLPSFVYWPSSLGKDAWMLLSLGIASYGAARVLAHRRGGLVLLALGCAVGSMVRVHVMLLVGGALAVSWIVGRAPRGARKGLVVRLAGGAVLVVACIVLFLQLQSEFAGDSRTGDVGSLLDFTSEQTTQGDSAFAAPRVNTPLDLPWATVTVLVRPFPFEANNAQALASAAEGVLLALILAMGWRRALHAVRSARRAPYVLVCIVFSLGFIVAFSNIGNFGILARQRVQVLPFVVALVCVPRTKSSPAHVAWQSPSVRSVTPERIG